MILRKEAVKLAFWQDDGEVTFNEVEGLVCAEAGLAVTPMYVIRGSKKVAYAVTHIPSGFIIMQPFPSKTIASAALEDLAVFDWRNVGPGNMPDEYHDLVKRVKREMNQ